MSDVARVPSPTIVLAAILAVVLAALPLEVEPLAADVRGHVALAGPGHGGSQGGGGPGAGDPEHGGRLGVRGGSTSYPNFDVSERARASTLGRAAYDRARERYGRATGSRPDGSRQAGRSPAAAPAPAAVLTPEETTALIARGWRSGAPERSFGRRGERTQTMVELARRMGYGARVGAMQARFGTPYENGIAALDTEIARTEAKFAADPGNLDLRAELDRLQAERQHLIQKVQPGRGPADAWVTVDLDANGDGRVDAQDLVALARGPTVRAAAFPAERAQ